MNSTLYRALTEALTQHHPHLRVELVRRTGDDAIVALVGAIDGTATHVAISFEAPASEPEPSHHLLSDPGRWRHQGDPPGTKFVDRSGHVPTHDGWQQYPISYGGDAYHGAPSVAPQWHVSKPDGEPLATLADLPAVIRFLRDGGY
jgi:hypothetical protein